MGCTPEQARINAQKSTGPKSKRGKAIVAQNARKHGLSARKPPVLGEEAEYYKALLDELNEHYQPQNPIEDHLVQTIAIGLLRQKRLWLVEILPPNPEEKPTSYPREDIPLEGDSHFNLDRPANRKVEKQILERLLKGFKGYLEWSGANPKSKYFLLEYERWLALALEAVHAAYQSYSGMISPPFNLIPPPEKEWKETYEYIQKYHAQNETLYNRIFHAYVSLKIEQEDIEKEPPKKTKTFVSRVRYRDSQIEEIREKAGDRLKEIAEMDERDRLEEQERREERERQALLEAVIKRSDSIVRYENHITRQLYDAIERLEKRKEKEK